MKSHRLQPSRLEGLLPKGIGLRLPFLAVGCASLLFLCSFPLAVRQELLAFRERKALKLEGQLNSSLAMAEQELLVLRRELTRTRTLLHQGTPKGLTSWFAFMESILKRSPGVHGMRIEFLPGLLPLPDNGKSLYVWRDQNGIMIRQDLSESAPSPIRASLEASRAHLESKVLWSDPFISKEAPRRLISIAIPLIRVEGESEIAFGLVGFDLPLDAFLDMFGTQDPGEARKSFVKDSKDCLWGKEQPTTLTLPAKMWDSHTGVFIGKEVPTATPFFYAMHRLPGLDPTTEALEPAPTPAIVFTSPASSASILMEKPLILLMVLWAAGISCLWFLIRWGVRHIQANLELLRHGIQLVLEGNFKKKLPAPATLDESAEVVVAFNDMVCEIEMEFSHIQNDLRKQQRDEAELHLAKTIQSTLFPGPIRPVGGSIAAMTLSGIEYGADFFDHFLLPGGRLAILVGDSPGKGIQATIFMMRTSQLLRSALCAMEPSHALAQVNSFLTRSNPHMLFVTLFLALWDPKSKSITFTNAGHNTPILMRSNGVFEDLTCSGGPVLGILPGQSYDMDTRAFQEGDHLVLYSKGISEAQDTRLTPFGVGRMKDILLQTQMQPVAISVQHLVDQAMAWQGSRERKHDLTLSIFRAERSPGHLCLPASMATVETVATLVEATAQAGGMDTPSAREMAMAVTEALTNVIIHGLKEDSNSFYDVFTAWNGEEFLVRIEDTGVPFDPNTLPLVHMKAASENRPVTGLGWVLIRQSTDHVQMERVGKTNILTLIRMKHRATTWQ